MHCKGAKICKIALLSLVLSMLLVPVGIASASTTKSKTVVATVEGYKYNLYSSTSNNSGNGRGLTTLKCMNGSKPAGYLRSYTTLHYGNDLIKTGINYNTNTNTFVQSMATQSGYSTYYTTGYGDVWHTANQKYIATGVAITPVAAKAAAFPQLFPVNESGKTYGSMKGISREAAPDLISVISDAGVRGFIMKADFDSCFALNPDDAMNDLNSGVKSISVFKEDGQTVIGKFSVYYNK